MKDQPEALRLADELDYVTYGIRDVSTTRVMDKASDELRRLSAENEHLHQRHHDDNVEYTRVLVQRDVLLEALRTLLSYAFTLEMRLIDADGEHRAMQKARAAIAAVEGEKT